eukprot:10285325-Karenia_brevis.AAC.1
MLLFKLPGVESMNFPWPGSAPQTMLEVVAAIPFVFDQAFVCHGLDRPLKRVVRLMVFLFWALHVTI